MLSQPERTNPVVLTFLLLQTPFLLLIQEQSSSFQLPRREEIGMHPAIGDGANAWCLFTTTIYFGSSWYYCIMQWAKKVRA